MEILLLFIFICVMEILSFFIFQALLKIPKCHFSQHPGFLPCTICTYPHYHVNVFILQVRRLKHNLFSLRWVFYVVITSKIKIFTHTEEDQN